MIPASMLEGLCRVFGGLVVAGACSVFQRFLVELASTGFWTFFHRDSFNTSPNACLSFRKQAEHRSNN